ncbi:flavodoxin-dependent (E)-4-hydroxy-3-methylbut-2-enyl-diphosphate synthase [[Eubacterium] hominis]|uniref:flavodoxin-dependent (E)-4-hydroxy-3-methylbut-2-enyl-diphosphate synthase n=1 Tax=[Eubacterium] hominis TaxID=2764325 RepID=UPI003A4D9676
MKRTETRAIQVRDLTIGHQNKVVIQSMCNTRTSDIEATVSQILALEKAGCEMVRMAIIDEADAIAITEIKRQTHIPLVADIHYDYRLAIKAIENGIDKIRLNPGNIGARENVEAVVQVCKKHHIPIRIGINSGSLEKDIHEAYGKPTAQGMMESAKRHINILESLDFHDICLSFKSSDPLLCIDAYRLASETFPYPLHLGVTEAGTFLGSAIKSSMALGTLLNEGIGDTIRISVNGDPVNEITIVKQLLKCCGLYSQTPNLIACPTCGRTAWDMQPVVDEMERFLQTIHCDVNVAIMGCAVNGPGEAKHADIAIAGGKKEGLLIKKGIIIEKLPQEQIVERLKQEIIAFEKEHGQQ